MQNTNWILRFFSISLITLILFACGNNETEKAAEQPQAPPPPVVEAPKEKQQVAPETITATYQSATVYAASTDYYFETKEGKILEIRVSNLKEQQKVKLPEGLLALAEEGPPEANPEMVGKAFSISYNENGEAVAISLAGN